jgi:hypothetical protein
MHEISHMRVIEDFSFLQCPRATCHPPQWQGDAFQQVLKQMHACAGAICTSSAPSLNIPIGPRQTCRDDKTPCTVTRLARCRGSSGYTPASDTHPLSVCIPSGPPSLRRPPPLKWWQSALLCIRASKRRPSSAHSAVARRTCGAFRRHCLSER